MSESLSQQFVSLLPGFAVAATVAWLMVHTRDLHIHFTGDDPKGGPQKLHSEAIPRIGGLAILAGLVAQLGWLYAKATPETRASLDAVHPFSLGLALVPLFVLGVIEDVRQAVSVRLRLGTSLIAGGIACFLAGVRVENLGLSFIDSLIHSVPMLSLLFPPLFTMVAVAGLVHAMNIIDGLNGLLAGLSLIILGVLAVVADGFGEQGLALLALSGMAATVGFAVFNFPKARIFCGDAGAYLIGYLIAVVAILLVLRQPSISPWFALAVIAHPVTETLYSVWRRYRLGLSPTHPDARHMHSLWATKLRRHCQATDETIWLGVNAGASWRTLVVASVPALVAAAIPTHNAGLQLLCASYLVVFFVTMRLLERKVDLEAVAPPLAVQDEVL